MKLNRWSITLKCSALPLSYDIVERVPQAIQYALERMFSFRHTLSFFFQAVVNWTQMMIENMNHRFQAIF